MAVKLESVGDTFRITGGGVGGKRRIEGGGVGPCRLLRTTSSLGGLVRSSSFVMPCTGRMETNMQDRSSNNTAIETISFMIQNGTNSIRAAAIGSASYRSHGCVQQWQRTPCGMGQRGRQQAIGNEQQTTRGMQQRKGTRTRSNGQQCRRRCARGTVQETIGNVQQTTCNVHGGKCN